jgi:hypothetical protein
MDSRGRFTLTPGVNPVANILQKAGPTKRLSNLKEKVLGRIRPSYNARPIVTGPLLLANGQLVDGDA